MHVQNYDGSGKYKSRSGQTGKRHFAKTSPSFAKLNRLPSPYGRTGGCGSPPYLDRATAVVSLFVPACRRVEAAGAVGRGTAPDALVRARPVTVLARGGMEASGTVACRAAPFAALLVFPVFMLSARTVQASGTIAYRTAMSAFRRHNDFPFAGIIPKSPSAFRLCRNSGKSRKSCLEHDRRRGRMLPMCSYLAAE